jgi:hypothetical protein
MNNGIGAGESRAYSMRVISDTIHCTDAREDIDTTSLHAYTFLKDN